MLTNVTGFLIWSVNKCHSSTTSENCVGCLSKETTEDNLKEMLDDAGVTVMRCRKLKTKSDSWTTAPFYVVCATFTGLAFTAVSNRVFPQVTLI